MIYTKPLPSKVKLRRLVKLVGPFPASARRIVDVAHHFGFGRDIISFLHLFHPNDIFRNRTDFMTRCEEMEILLEEERQMPPERLLSPQD